MQRGEPVDLRDVPVVDNHCHNVFPHPEYGEVAEWRAAFTESTEPGMAREHVPTTAFYRRLVRALAEFFGCDPDEEAVFEARNTQGAQKLTGDLLRSANIETLLVDTGHPPPEDVLPLDELAGLGGCRTKPMLRLEVLMQRLLAEHDSLEDVKDALAAELEDVRGQGYVALKSIAAYRTGLDIREWPDEDTEVSLREYRRDSEEGEARLDHKPLLDTLLHVAFAEAARQEVPVQFHVGYGDADTDLLLSNPLLLRAVLRRPEYRGMPVVLLHECYPYTREGGYLAAVCENVYLDLSYAIPLLGFGEMLDFMRAALGVAPTSKLMYSSDGIGVPELHWMGALDGRRVIGQALGGLVKSGELTLSEAEAAGEDVLRRNAVSLYGLSFG